MSKLKNAVENFVSVQRLSVRFNRSESNIKSHASDLGLILPTVQRFRERILGRPKALESRRDNVNLVVE